MKPVAVIAVLFAVAACGSTATPSSSSAQGAGAPPAGRPASVDASRRTAITSAAERVAPSVVTVQVETRSAAQVDMFEWFSGRNSGERVQASMGSGFIIRQDGIIVTNAHVVTDATMVSVAMRDGKTYEAKVLGLDGLNDIAVLRINATNLPVAPLGNSSDVIVGEWAIAIGNPFGFVLGNADPTVTAGVISGTGRNLLARTAGETGTYDMIQTDAAINPGNSGGPLVNALGEVIGMNTVIYTPSQGSVGLGFAVPINRVKRVAEDLIAHGVIRMPWVGVKLREPPSDNPREAVALGAIVETVVPASPAAEAGVRAGDQILRAGTQPIRNYFAWASVALDLRVGDRVPLHLKRGNAELDVTILVADKPEQNAPKVAALNELELITLTPAIRGEKDIHATAGALVFNATARITSQWDIRKDDVIIRIGNIDISSADAARRAFDRYSGAGPFYMYFERGGANYRTVAQVAR